LGAQRCPGSAPIRGHRWRQSPRDPGSRVRRAVHGERPGLAGNPICVLLPNHRSWPRPPAVAAADQSPRIPNPRWPPPTGGQPLDRRPPAHGQSGHCQPRLPGQEYSRRERPGPARVPLNQLANHPSWCNRPSWLTNWPCGWPTGLHGCPTGRGPGGRSGVVSVAINRTVADRSEDGHGRAGRTWLATWP